MVWANTTRAAPAGVKPVINRSMVTVATWPAGSLDHPAAPVATRARGSTEMRRCACPREIAPWPQAAVASG